MITHSETNYKTHRLQQWFDRFYETSFHPGLSKSTAFPDGKFDETKKARPPQQCVRRGPSRCQFTSIYTEIQ